MPFTIVKKSTIRSLQRQIETSNRRVEDLEIEIDGYLELDKEVGARIAELEATVKHQDEVIQGQRTKNQVSFQINDLLTEVTPTVKWREEVVDSLVQSGFLNIRDENNKYAIQLALMTVAYDALSSIIDQFSAEVDDE